jgi:hypothetical protein
MLKQLLILFLTLLLSLSLVGCFSDSSLIIKEESSKQVSTVSIAKAVSSQVVSSTIVASSKVNSSKKAVVSIPMQSVASTISSSTAPIDPNADLKKQISQKYNVDILYGDDTIWDLSETDINISYLRDPTYIKYGLTLIDVQLSKYPQGFFGDLSRKLRIFLITSLSKNYVGLASYKNPKYFELYLASNEYSVSTIHHELMHMVDFTFNDKSNKADDFNNWDSYNFSGFSYTNNDENDYNNVYTKNSDLQSMYFVSAYSKKEQLEDRAELFSDLMTSTSVKPYYTIDCPLKRKLLYLTSEIRRLMPSVQNASSVEWEKNLIK